MLAQYLDLLGATSLRRSEKKSFKAVNSPQVNKERSFHVHLLVESFSIISQKYFLRQGFSLNLVLNLLLILQQMSGSLSYRIVLIDKECNTTPRQQMKKLRWAKSLQNCKHRLTTVILQSRDP